MSSCEKCWRDSAGDDHAARYAELMDERERAGKVCTDEEQAGPDATECPVCHRMTLHQYTREPMCGCPARRCVLCNKFLKADELHATCPDCIAAGKLL